MGWVLAPVFDENGLEVETGRYKLWTSLANEQDAGEDGAEDHVDGVLDYLRHRHLLGSVSALKVSTDAQCILVVYLGVGVDPHGSEARDVADVMRRYCGSPAVKVGWSHVSGSEVLAIL